MDSPNASVQVVHSSLSYSRQPALLPTMGFPLSGSFFFSSCLPHHIFSLHVFDISSFLFLFPLFSIHLQSFSVPSAPPIIHRHIHPVCRDSHFPRIIAFIDIASRKYSPTLSLSHQTVSGAQDGAPPSPRERLSALVWMVNLCHYRRWTHHPRKSVRIFAPMISSFLSAWRFSLCTNLACLSRRFFTTLMFPTLLSWYFSSSPALSHVVSERLLPHP